MGKKEGSRSSNNFDQFLESLSRALGIPRKSLRKFIYRRPEQLTSRRKSATARKTRRRSGSLAQ